ncbi:MAG: hypothetical protein HWE16_06955 [Gammaproteobacteria bacterium]|nr:hypothetical protein [Gammaproteobacteria bacterium]
MFTDNLKAHERILIEEAFPKELNELVLTLLGINQTRLGYFAEMFCKNDNIKVPSYLVDAIVPEELENLPAVELNYGKSSLKAAWKLCGEELELQGSEDYANKLEAMIDEVFPYGNQRSDIIPVTILIPGNNYSVDNSLVGRESSWKHYSLNYDSAGKVLGFEDLCSDPKLGFGLRLFLVMKVLGMVKLGQYQKNNSKLFTHLMYSTKLKNQFYLFGSEKLKEYRKIHHKLEGNLKRCKELELEISSAKESSKRGSLKRKKTELKDTQDLIRKLDKQCNSFNFEYDGIERHFGFYYTLDRRPGASEKRAEANYLFPTLNLKKSKSFGYRDNRIELDKGKPSPRYLRRVRFALNYLMPLTGGTAITLKIKNTELKEIKGPTLILPKTWNDFVIALKTHNPNEETASYSDTLEENEFNELCKSAVYMDYWHKREVFMRVFPRIRNTSSEDIAVKP